MESTSTTMSGSRMASDTSSPESSTHTPPLSGRIDKALPEVAQDIYARTLDPKLKVLAVVVEPVMVRRDMADEPPTMRLSVPLPTVVM